METEEKWTHYKNTAYTQDTLDGEYADCVFESCNFYQLHFGKVALSNCVFRNCNFSLAVFAGKACHDVKFEGCKMTGCDFTNTNSFSHYRFEECLLDYSIFRNVRMQKTPFVKCNLIEADFAEAQLKGSCFTYCDLERAFFSNTDLTEVDFSTAMNVTINPQFNKMRKAKFSRTNLEGLVAHLGLQLLP